MIGAILPFAAKARAADLVPVSAIRVYPLELGFAILYGLLVTLGFALGPLGRARQLPASSLFADRAVHAPQKPPLALSRWRRPLRSSLSRRSRFGSPATSELSLFYIGAVIGAFVVLRLVAIGDHDGRARASTACAARRCGLPSATSTGPAR